MSEFKEVVIDADFFIKMTCVDRTGQLFLDFMNCIKRVPVMDEFVYNTEIRGEAKNTAEKLKDLGKIRIYFHQDYLSEAERDDYIDDFCFLYKAMTGQDFDIELLDVFTYFKKDENLGEIRSIIMARKKNIEYFFSDDNGVKRLVKTVFSKNRSISVYNVFDMMKLAKKEGCNIEWDRIEQTARLAFCQNKSKFEYIEKQYKEYTIGNT